MFDFSNREMVTKKLEELKARNIPCMTYKKLCEKRTLNASKEEIDAINEYFKSYCEAGYNDGKDIFSDEECCFYWGLGHGEMLTNDNGMNRTYYHYLTINGERNRIEILLQYHPNGYSIDNNNTDI